MQMDHQYQCKNEMKLFKYLFKFHIRTKIQSHIKSHNSIGKHIKTEISNLKFRGKSKLKR